MLEPIVSDINVEDPRPWESSTGQRTSLISCRQRNTTHPAVEGISVDRDVLRHLEFHETLWTAAGAGLRGTGLGCGAASLLHRQVCRLSVSRVDQPSPLRESARVAVFPAIYEEPASSNTRDWP